MQSYGVSIDIKMRAYETIYANSREEAYDMMIDHLYDTLPMDFEVDSYDIEKEDGYDD